MCVCVPAPAQVIDPLKAHGRLIGEDDDPLPPAPGNGDGDEDADEAEDDDEDDDEDDEISMEPEVEIPVPSDLRVVTRRILADKPRVTKFPIDWDVS
jgi:hypothetical protein